MNKFGPIGPITWTGLQSSKALHHKTGGLVVFTLSIQGTLNNLPHLPIHTHSNEHFL